MSLMDETPPPTGAAHVHTIQVDPSLTGLEAFTELCIFGQRVTFTGEATTSTVNGCDGEQCRLIGTV